MQLDAPRRKFSSKALAALVGVPRMFARIGRTQLGLPLQPRLCYIAPGVDWVIDQVGASITSEVSRQFSLRASVMRSPRWHVGDIIHYGDVWSFLKSLEGTWNKHNTVVATVFHGDRDNRYPQLALAMDQLVNGADAAERVVTASRLMERRLHSWGLPREKVVRIPLGVDLTLFVPPSVHQRAASRERFGIPSDAVCIGSFQKDGHGWSDGLEPKLIKGPDVFLDVIKRLKEAYNLCVLLSAPARGFVKRGLTQLGVPYVHTYLPAYGDIVALYQCLDLYLVTSREEGGPAAILEAQACGVPVVSTRVGMAPEVIQSGVNGFLAEPDDPESLAILAASVMDARDLHRRLRSNALEGVRDYDWVRIAAEYHQRVYAPLLRERLL